MHFDSDTDALLFLSAYGIQERRNGVLRLKEEQLSDLDIQEAVYYLIQEWDFCVEIEDFLL